MRHDLTLLYVEDDDIIRENYTEIFKTYFDNVITSKNGNEALELYKKNAIDIAILDILIPGMDGLTLAKEMKQDNPEIFILIISAYSDSDKLLKAINIGLVGYLIKPLSLTELDTSIKNLLDKIPNKAPIPLGNNYFWSPQSNTLLYKNIILKLTKNETKTIQALYTYKNKYLTACQIQDELLIKKSIDDNSCNNIVQLISRFKKKILTITKKDTFFIENCYGNGYKITVSI